MQRFSIARQQSARGEAIADGSGVHVVTVVSFIVQCFLPALSQIKVIVYWDIYDEVNACSRWASSLSFTMISFKGSHYPKDVVLFAVFFYVRYAVSCRDLEEIMAERGVDVDHATLNSGVVKYSPLIACRARRRQSQTSNSWRMDETYIKVKGVWMYLHSAVDRYGRTLDFRRYEHRGEAAAAAFLARTKPLWHSPWCSACGCAKQKAFCIGAATNGTGSRRPGSHDIEPAGTNIAIV